jgi:hypothetical protein
VSKRRLNKNSMIRINYKKIKVSRNKDNNKELKKIYRQSWNHDQTQNPKVK